MADRSIQEDELRVVGLRDVDTKRPIGPEDEALVIAAFHKVSPDNARLRFLSPIKEPTLCRFPAFEKRVAPDDPALELVRLPL